MSDNDSKIVIPTSTKFDVGMSMVTLIVVVGAIVTMLFMQTPVDFENASPLMRAVIIGAGLGTVFGVAVVCFNITCFILIAIGSSLWVGLLALKEKLFGNG